MSCTSKFKLLPPGVRGLVERYIEEHAPLSPAADPVVVPRQVFDALVLAALAGLEAADDEGVKA